MKLLNFLKSKWEKYKPVARWLFEQSKGTKRYIIGFMLISMAGMLFSLASPVASKYVVDAAIGYNSEFQLKYVLIMLGTTVISILIGILSNMFSSYANEKYAFSVRAKMFDKAQREDWLGISKFHSGDVINRLVNDVDIIASNIISILPNLFVTLIQLIIVLVIVLIYDPMIAVIGLVAGPLGILMSILYRKPYRECQKELFETQSEYYTFFQESFSNVSVVKSFQLEDSNNQFLENIRGRRLKVVMRSAKLRSVMSSLTSLIFRLGYVAAFAWCAHRISTDPEYTYGTMTLFLSLVSLIQSSVSNLGGFVPRTISLLVSAARVREITEQTQEDYNSKDCPRPENVGVRFKNVSFRYEEDTILDNVSLDIKPGSHVGIVGSSGVGKTTLIRLLLSLIHSDGGEVEYYNSEGFLEKASASSRRLVSYVPQGNTLFSRTVRENLLSGDPAATDEMMWNALELADAARFVRKNKLGLDMPIHERSSGMSAGQAQRICIARALLRDRPIIIFDEATSALDEPTETRIFEQIIKKTDKTCFVITHRSTMLKYCDAVFEINEDGKIKER